MLGLACATPSPDPGWDFFAPPRADLDAWYPKVTEWQTRAQAQPSPALPPPPAEEGGYRWGPRPPASGLDPLPEKLAAFAATQREHLAGRIAHWSRRTAVWYYQSDVPVEKRPPEAGRVLSEDPADDHWPTYAELIEQNGNDCDGLDLVAYRMLQEFGFPEDQLFRGVVRRDRDSANHMVTFWFEDPADPWVFDATGAMTQDFVRFSEISGWTPTVIFNERQHYAVRSRKPQLGRSARADSPALD